MARLHIACAALLLCGAPSLRGEPLPRPPQPLVGLRAFTVVGPRDTLVDLAFRHRVGFGALTRLNPDIEVWVPQPGTRVRLPGPYVLPDAPRQGLVVNLPEMRLYDFTGGHTPRILALAIGDPEHRSPIGTFTIGAMRSDPIWYVPASIRSERPELAAAIPPGPDNPLGSRWMTLGTTYYGIHGTHLPWSIGRTTTHGCLRLYDDEMRGLYDRVAPGVPVRIVYQSLKLGESPRGELFLEAHPDVYARERDRVLALWIRLRELGLTRRVDPELVARGVREQRGVPVPIERTATLRNP